MATAEKKRYSHAAALSVAREIASVLAPSCERLAIAGSLRRLKPQVGDIELLYVPKYGQAIPRGRLFPETANLTDLEIDRLVRETKLSKRPNINGGFIYGEKNKLLIHVASGIPVDLFATTLENWWVALVIRTGSKETNLRLTTGAQARGCSLMAYGRGVRHNTTGTITQAFSEEEVFSLCGVPYLEPRDR